MALLGQAVTVTPNAEIVVYAPASGIRATVFVIAANRNTAQIAVVTVIHRPGGPPSQAANTIVPGTTLPSLEERITFQFDIAHPEELVVRADRADVAFTCNGIERPA